VPYPFHSTATARRIKAGIFITAIRSHNIATAHVCVSLGIFHIHGARILFFFFCQNIFVFHGSNPPHESIFAWRYASDSQRLLKNDEFHTKHISQFIFVNNNGKRRVPGTGRSTPSVHFIFSRIEYQGMPPMWGAYVTVDDVDLTARTAEQLGARLLVPPTDIPNVGRFCVIQDPQGAVINAITYIKMQ
jgi:hypothetical protein